MYYCPWEHHHDNNADSLTVHGVLLSLHQPYLPSPRPSSRFHHHHHHHYHYHYHDHPHNPDHYHRHHHSDQVPPIKKFFSVSLHYGVCLVWPFPGTIYVQSLPSPIQVPWVQSNDRQYIKSSSNVQIILFYYIFNHTKASQWSRYSNVFNAFQLGVKYGTSRTRLAIAGRIYEEVLSRLKLMNMN